MAKTSCPASPASLQPFCRILRLQISNRRTRWGWQWRPRGMDRTTSARRRQQEAPPPEDHRGLTYSAQLGSWLTVQPDLQYVIHPGGTRATQNAVVSGLRVAVSH